MLQSEIVGTVKMRCYLSGMPELRLGLNDKILFESTGRKWIHTVYLFSIALASVTFSAQYPYTNSSDWSPGLPLRVLSICQNWPAGPWLAWLV